MMNPLNLAPAASIDELLGHHDARFVACAYLTLLKRPVDDEGLANYTKHLRAGMSRAEIVASLVHSEEGRAAHAKLAGLQALLSQADAPAPTRWQNLVQRLTALALRPVRQQLNRLENQMGRALQEGVERQLRLETQLADVMRRHDQLQQLMTERLAHATTGSYTARGCLPTEASSAPTLDDGAIERVRTLLAGEQVNP